MTCGHCQDCKWWDAWSTAPPWGGCRRVLADDSLAQPEPRTFESGIDRNNEDSELAVLPNFGCVQFEAKP